MQWDKLLNCDRLNEAPKPFDEARNPFSIDFDRIIFSDSFRRLDRKTQVHPMRSNDNVHSRLPHSLEVSCVGRSLGTLVGARIEKLPEHMNPDRIGQIVQAACLAHDIGNPPFGHMGETIISEWFTTNGTKYFESLSESQKTDFTAFEGNAQALRIMTRLAMYKNDGGLRPTYAVIATMMKYPWVKYNDDLKKYCAFRSESGILEDIAQKTGLAGEDGVYSRHPLAYLSEAADDICYSIIDLEDAYEMGILRYEEVRNLMNGICGAAEEKLSGKTPKEAIAYLRAIAINKCVGAVVDEFFENYGAIMDGSLGKYNLPENSVFAEPIKRIKDLSSEVIYQNSRKLMLEVGAYNVMSILLETFCEAVYDHVSEGKSKDRTNHIIKIMGDSAPAEGDGMYEALHKVTDYISGMTDNYATEMARQISGI